MGQWNMLYDMYERRLKAELSDAAVPKHIGVILDGNRRWAKSLGATASQGHRAGAGKIAEFLDWSEDAGVSIVTLWLLSTDNLARDEGELGELLRIICEAVSLLADQGRWKLAVVGDLALLPEQVSEDLRASVARTASVQGMTVNVAVGYGGRHEITEAVRAMMHEPRQRDSPSTNSPTLSPTRTSPPTCTRRISPTPTSSSEPRENSVSPASCCGSPCTPNTTSVRSTGRTSVASTSCAPALLRSA